MEQSSNALPQEYSAMIREAYEALIRDRGVVSVHHRKAIAWDVIVAARTGVTTAEELMRIVNSKA